MGVWINASSRPLLSDQVLVSPMPGSIASSHTSTKTGMV
jgi:hypothetical protein